MALINCPECGKEISNMAKTCPHCGVSLCNCQKARKKTNWPKIIIIFSAVVLILAIILMNTFTDWLVPAKVTADEFNQIHAGMSYEEVCRIIGTEYVDRRLETNEGSPAPEQLFYTYEGVGAEGCEVIICFVNNKVQWKKHTGLFGEGLTENWELS